MKLNELLLNSSEEELNLSSSGFKNLKLFIKRDDLIHPEISGNKLRKLKYNIENAVQLKKEGIVTFGGAFSNHLLATAAACNLVGLKSIGIVRGEELTSISNSNLIRCSELGMELIFVSRTNYGDRNEKMTQEEWKERYPSFLFVPEGGANFHGIVGCQESVKEWQNTPNHVFVSFGTGTTACGILAGLNAKTQLHVVSSLKGYDVIEAMRKLLYYFLLDKEFIEELLLQVSVHNDAHFGGYGKVNENLLNFKTWVFNEFQLPLDKVYTAKTFYAMWEWMKTKDQELVHEINVLFIHTGGLMNG